MAGFGFFLKKILCVRFVLLLSVSFFISSEKHGRTTEVLLPIRMSCTLPCRNGEIPAGKFQKAISKHKT